MSDELDLSQFKDAFVAEARENLQSLNTALVRLEKNSSDQETLKEIFRISHTLKGMSATMGYENITKLTHKMEDVLDKIRKGEATPGRKLVDTIFSCLDTLETLVNEVENTNTANTDPTLIIGQLEDILTATDTGNNIQISDHSQQNQSVSQNTRQQEEISSTPIITASASSPEEKDTKTDKPSNTITTVKEEDKKSQSATTIRVNISHLDAMMNLVGEMVIAKAQLEQIARKHKIEELTSTLEQFDRIAIDLQGAVLKTRMVPIHQIFDRYPRMMRDIARKLNKEINFEIYGSDIEIDRLLLDEINEPLVHLLRNAADHGIETLEERKKTNKSPIGKIILEARRERGHISIIVSDDGKGMDPAKIRRKAIERNIINETEAAKISDEDAYYLICDPRFSTAEKITDISGRGVGMDVVKSMIESFNGRLFIKSQKGSGSTFILELPLSMAIISSLLVKVKNETYAIPLNNITEIISLPANEIKTIENREVILLRNEVLPLIRLGNKLGIKNTDNGKKTIYTLRIETQGKTAAISVDELIGRKEIVIKTLSGIVKHSKGLSGATITGDGTVVLILDISSFI